MLSLHNVSKHFPGVQALSDVSFTIAPGEIHALVGENGAGKSTLMKILAGVHPDFDGEMRLADERYRPANPRDAQRHGIAIIHQELNLVPELTIAENIFLGREPRTALGLIGRRAMEQEARGLLASLEVDVDPRRPVNSLRIGEQQLVEVAKALSLDAKVLILDEPTSALSRTEIDHLFAVIATLRQRGVTMVYISHKFDEIFALADTITVLRDGRHVETVAAGDTSEAEIIRLMVGRELADLFPKSNVVPGAEILRVESLGYTPPPSVQQRPLRDISFTLNRGEILGIAGLMGSGRTELLESLYGVHAPPVRTGSIAIDGERRTIRSPRDAIANGIAFVTEDRKLQSLVLGMSVAHNISLQSLRHLSRMGVVRAARERQVVQRTIDQLRIKTPGSATIAEKLSGGNQQKIVLGKCLLTKPDILLLDEPTRGIDIGAKAEIYALMSDLVEQGASIIMASSELPELLAMCDRIVVLHEGQLAAVLDRSEASQVAIMAAATGRPHAPAA